jgi:hypothetical protein
MDQGLVSHREGSEPLQLLDMPKPLCVPIEALLCVPIRASDSQHGASAHSVGEDRGIRAEGRVEAREGGDDLCCGWLIR